MYSKKLFRLLNQCFNLLFVPSVVLIVLNFSLAFAQNCRSDWVELKGDWGRGSFRVSVADNPKKRAKGLMYVDTLPKRSGMLFVYKSPNRVSFWMKNTLIPLDMLFFNNQGLLLRIHKNVQPHDLIPKEGGSGVKFVLEINGGIADIYGIEEGNIMRHPTIGSSALWPC